MNFENYPCPACGAHLHEEDDVVVCPVCGTPQHRACWTENGTCVNEAKHAEGFRWSAQEREYSGGEETVTEAPETADSVRRCHICGSENPADITHCGHCGAMLDTDSDAPATTVCVYCGTENSAENTHCKNCGAPLTPYVRHHENPFIAATGLDENEPIGDQTAGELAYYVRRGAPRYLDRFRKFESGKKISFNFAAFFFGFMWMFSRKLYKYGLIIMVLLATVSLIFSASPGMQRAYEIIQPYYDDFATGQLATEKMIEIETEMFNAMKTPALLAGLAFLALNLFCGFAGDRLYYKKMRTDIKTIKEQIPDRNMQLMYMARRGGLSVLSGFCSYFVYRMMGMALSYIAEYVSGKI